MLRSKIPFSWLPESWKLEGKERQRAYAKHTLTGEELEQELLDIEHSDKESNAYKLAKLELQAKYNKIKPDELEKQKATIKSEPYFKILSGDYKETGPSQGTMMFELDWNEYFVKDLKKNGWTGVSDDVIVNLWFEDSCKQMLQEEETEPLSPPITSYNRTRKRPLDDDTTEYS